MTVLHRNQINLAQPSGDPFWAITACNHMYEVTGSRDYWHGDIVSIECQKFKEISLNEADKDLSARAFRLSQVLEHWLAG